MVPSDLSDSELLVATRRLVGRSNQLLAALLAHLGEVEARGVHRSRACASLYTYCIYELRFSEDEAFRRVSAARLVRRFPALLDVIAAGELHLTGLLMLGPHLTNENLAGVLAHAKHRTKKEIARLVRILDPLPAVPARIEPLGSAPARVQPFGSATARVQPLGSAPVRVQRFGSAPARLVPKTPTWAEFMQSLRPVRELSAGERPRDWVDPVSDGANDAENARPAASGPTSEPGVLPEALHGVAPAALPETVHEVAPAALPEVLQRVVPGALSGVLDRVAPAALPEVLDRVVPAALPEVSGVLPGALPEALRETTNHAAPARLGPERYGVHFTAGEEYVALVGEAQALLSHSAAGISLDELHLRAMRALVAELKRRKYGRPAPRLKLDEPAAGAIRGAIEGAPKRSLTAKGANDETPPEPGSALGSAGRGAVVYTARVPEHEHEHAEQPRRRGRAQRARHVPAAVRRAVYQRDGARCTYTDGSGLRCAETRRLELHHVEPFAHGGEHTPNNLTLHCRAHNALAAEQDLGRDFMQQHQRSENHERWGE